MFTLKENGRNKMEGCTQEHCLNAEMTLSDLFAHISPPLLRSMWMSLLEHPTSKQSLQCFSIPGRSCRSWILPVSLGFLATPQNACGFLVREVSHIEQLCNPFRSLTCWVLFNSSSLTAFFSPQVRVKCKQGFEFTFLFANWSLCWFQWLAWIHLVFH